MAPPRFELFVSVVTSLVASGVPESCYRFTGPVVPFSNGTRTRQQPSEGTHNCTARCTHQGANMKERATVICRRDDTVLFVRHRIRWALPGGAVRANESPRQCAHRELEEETSLVAVSSAYLWQFVGFNKRHHVFIVEIADSADPQPRNEVRSCRWFVPRDIETLLVSVPTRSILELASGRRGHAWQWTSQKPRKAGSYDAHLPWE